MTLPPCPLIISSHFPSGYCHYVLYFNVSAHIFKLLGIYLLFTFIIFNYSCLHFPSITLPHPIHPHLPPSILPHLGFVHGSYIHDPSWLFPFISPLLPTLLPCGYCQVNLYFNASGYTLLASLFCWLGFPYKWDHMVFVFHCLAYFT